MPQPKPTSRRRVWPIATVVAALAFFVVFLLLRQHHSTAPPGRSSRATRDSDAAVFARYAGSTSCRDCHSEEYSQWAQSHHGLAERPFESRSDREAFEPTRTLTLGTTKTEMRMSEDRGEIIATGLLGTSEAYRVERVIGHEPLRQFLVSAPGGRLQTMEATFDPRKKEWFNVFGDEKRMPGDWGHWTGRGMNWNARCASCHNTRLRKNYEPATDTFHTSMAEMSVGCEACHGPMKAHVEWRRSHSQSSEPDPTLTKLSRDQVFDTCGSCHSRRGEVTGDFSPGQKFSDHFSLTVVDESDTYFADGQVRDEDYEFGSFVGSKMHAAGVRCIDCHQPHSAKPLVPGNALCLRCHGGASPPELSRPAPVIDPIAHSHHGPSSAGSQCTSCHMPVTTYMQRHPRHDHGFTIPDPLLTETLGIPNACNRCHQDKASAWARAAVDGWYGGKMNRASRDRAQFVAAARRGDAAGRHGLLALLDDPATEPYWRASAIRLLERWISDGRVIETILGQAGHANAMVREATARSLEVAATVRPEIRERIRELASDPDRSVRVAAAWSLRDTLPLEATAMVELEHMLAENADQPSGQMQLGSLFEARRDVDRALHHFATAIRWDPNSPPFRHDYAVALSGAGRNGEAISQLAECVRLDPHNAEFHYKLGLAWNEIGRTDKALSELRQAVQHDPRHARAWYNLGLAQHAFHDSAGALLSMQRGEAADPNDPGIPYAYATILAQLGRADEARAAARRALLIRPDFSMAEQLLRQLGE